MIREDNTRDLEEALRKLREVLEEREDKSFPMSAVDKPRYQDEGGD